jgi:hypothetical protein
LFGHPKNNIQQHFLTQEKKKKKKKPSINDPNKKDSNRVDLKQYPPKPDFTEVKQNTQKSTLGWLFLFNTVHYASVYQ